MSAQHADSTGDGAPRKRAGLFDIRATIGLLLGIYGVVLTVYGLFGTSEADLAKADGTNLNLWTGVLLILAGAFFLIWARVRPVLVPDHHDEQRESGQPGH